MLFLQTVTNNEYIKQANRFDWDLYTIADITYLFHQHGESMEDQLQIGMHASIHQ